MGIVVLSLRGAAAIVVITSLVGGMPRLVQAGLAIAVGFWAAWLGGVPLADGSLALVAVRELVVGATLGLLVALPLVAVITAGRLVDFAGTRRSAGPYTALFGILGAAVFVGIDAHVAVVTAIVESFRAAPSLAATRPGVWTAITGLVPAAFRLAVPWLVTAAAVELAVGVGMRLAGRAGSHVPAHASVPAALMMMTASLVSVLAIAVAALVRGALVS